MHLLKKWVLFPWDDQSQHSFDDLKQALLSAPLLKPSSLNRDILLYLSALEYSLGMVLVQEDNMHNEHHIYYLRKDMIGLELHYSHVQKLALTAVIVVQQLRHYILLQNTMVIVHSNPMKHIISRQIIG